MILHVTKTEEFENAIAKGDVLVDFYATWCGPCQMLSPIIEEIAKENEDLTIVKVDVDELPSVASKYGVSSIPTLIHFKDGENVNSTLGYQPKTKLLRFLGQ